MISRVVAMTHNFGMYNYRITQSTNSNIMSYEEAIIKFCTASGLTEHEILVRMKHLNIGLDNCYDFYITTERFPTALEAQFIYTAGIKNWRMLHEAKITFPN